MATEVTLEQVKELAARLPADERRRLAETILRELGETPSAQPADWMSLRGIAPNLLDGEDAQEWVTRTRREADEHRERQWRRPES